jgi:hypothetical protein
MLRSTYEDEIPLETAAENFAEDYSQLVTDKVPLLVKRKIRRSRESVTRTEFTNLQGSAVYWG